MRIELLADWYKPEYKTCGAFATITKIRNKEKTVELTNFSASRDTVWSYSMDMLKPASTKERV